MKSIGNAIDEERNLIVEDWRGSFDGWMAVDEHLTLTTWFECNQLDEVIQADPWPMTCDILDDTLSNDQFQTASPSHLLLSTVSPVPAHRWRWRALLSPPPLSSSSFRLHLNASVCRIAALPIVWVFQQANFIQLWAASGATVAGLHQPI